MYNFQKIIVIDIEIQYPFLNTNKKIKLRVNNTTIILYKISTKNLPSRKITEN